MEGPGSIFLPFIVAARFPEPLDVARTTANATLRKLVSAGQITLAYGRVYVIKPDALRAMLAE
jgi:hypothetical protein